MGICENQYKFVKEYALDKINSPDVKMLELGDQVLNNHQNFFDGIKTAGFEFIVLKIKGDGKSYQFRLKSSDNQRQSYIYTFSTTGLEQDIIIPLKDFYPSFRGRILDIPNFDADQIEQIAFLIGNKTKELFSLKIKSISLK